jgi:hypothetical protein
MSKRRNGRLDFISLVSVSVMVSVSGLVFWMRQWADWLSMLWPLEAYFEGVGFWTG